MFLIFSFCLLPVNDGSAYYLITQKGEVLEVTSKPSFEKRNCRITLPNGEDMLLPTAYIDQQKTLEYNRLKGEQAENKAREEAEKKELSEQEKLYAQEAREIRTRFLPTYTDAQNRVSGLAASNDGSPEPIGEPLVFNKTSNDPVYISQEKRTKFASGYRIETTVYVKNPAGARSITLTLTAHFGSGSPITMQKNLDPPDLNFGQRAALIFDLTSSSELTRTEFVISADLAAAQ